MNKSLSSSIENYNLFYLNLNYDLNRLVAYGVSEIGSYIEDQQTPKKKINNFIVGINSMLSDLTINEPKGLDVECRKNHIKIFDNSVPAIKVDDINATLSELSHKAVLYKEYVKASIDYMIEFNIFSLFEISRVHKKYELILNDIFSEKEMNILFGTNADNTQIKEKHFDEIVKFYQYVIMDLTALILDKEAYIDLDTFLISENSRESLILMENTMAGNNRFGDLEFSNVYEVGESQKICSYMINTISATLISELPKDMGIPTNKVIPVVEKEKDSIWQKIVNIESIPSDKALNIYPILSNKNHRLYGRLKYLISDGYNYDSKDIDYALNKEHGSKICQELSDMTKINGFTLATYGRMLVDSVTSKLFSDPSF